MKLRKSKVFTTLLLIFISQYLYGQAKKTLAILDLQPIGISEQEGKAFTERLCSEIVGTKYFVVLERRKIEEILDETEFQLSGCTSSECMIEAGQILGVQLMIGGSVSKVGNLYSVNIRLIDVETSEILNKATEDIYGSIEDLFKNGTKIVAKKLISDSYNIDINEGEITRNNNLSRNIVKDIDGNEYKTVKIGNQIWMAENLKVGHYRNGDPIKFISDKSEWNTQYNGSYCFYNNDLNIANIYGYLYNWYAINDIRNIAPEGWHVPTDSDWQILIDYLGGAKIAGGKIKEVSSKWTNPNSGATNESSFSAIPSGSIERDGLFKGIGNYVAFWSSLEASNENAWVRYLNYYLSGIYRVNWSKCSGYSVRCIKD